MKRNLCLFISLFLFITSPTFAQDDGVGNQPMLGTIGAHAGVVLPRGDFGDDVSDPTNGDGYAGTGVSVGGTYNYPLAPNGLGWFSSLSVIVNGYDAEKAYGTGSSSINTDSDTGLIFPL